MLTTFLALPFVCSAAVSAACLLWCRGVLPILATSFAVALCWVIA